MRTKKILKAVCLSVLLCMCFVSCAKGGSSQAATETSETKSEIESEAQSEVKSKTTINAMSYNVWGGGDKTTTANDGTPLPSMSVLARGQKVNKLLNGEDIDVAGFQEVSNRTEWVNWMTKSLDKKYSYIAANTSDIGSGAYIVYQNERLEAIDSGAFCLAAGAPALKAGTPQKFKDSDFERICNWAIFKIKETGEIFIFMNTHLAAGTASGSSLTVSEVRSKQLEVLTSQISVLREKAKTAYGVSNCPTILVGDMNSKPTSNEYSILTKTLKDSLKVSKGKSVDEKYDTFTNFWHCVNEYSSYATRGNRIDYLFITKENISVLNYKMIHTSTNLCPYGEYMSDHNAVIAKYELY